MADEKGQETEVMTDTNDSQDDLLSAMEGEGSGGIREESFSDNGNQGGLREVGFSDEQAGEEEESDGIIDVFKEIEKRNPETPTDSSPDEDDSVSGEGEDAPEGEQEEEEEEKETDEPSFSDDLLQRAEDYGYSDEEARSFGTPDNLQKALQTLDDRTRQDDPSDESGDGQPPETEDDEFEIDLDPSLYDPEIVDTMKNMKNHYQGQLEQMQEQVQSVNEQLIQRDVQAQEAEFDSIFSDMGEEFAEIIGDKPLQQLEGDERDNREKAIDEAWEQLDRRLEKGEDLDAGEIAESALNAVFGDRVNKVARKQVRNEVKERNEQSIGRPSGRDGQESLSRDEKAVQTVRKFRQKSESEPREF